MKAAVIFQKGEFPRYVTDFAMPIAQNEDELLMTVKASAVKHLDRTRSSGKHYSTSGREWTAKVPGGDGVGVLADGTRIYAIGVSGMLAEKAIIEKERMVQLPSDLDDATAAALPNAVMGSALAMRFRAQLQKGETVLINGATGVTGKLAVQIAKYYGAKKVIATGRNEIVLNQLLLLGADEVISLKQDDEQLVAQLKAFQQENPIDIVIDYLWGRSAEHILSALKGSGGFTHRTRYITVGAMLGDSVTLSSGMLRSTDLQISGSGLGSWTPAETRLLFTEILPEMFLLAAAGKLKIDTQCVNLSEIENTWDMHVDGGKRLVVII